jgi:DNA-3-methyladenine glycosylase II
LKNKKALKHQKIRLHFKKVDPVIYAAMKNLDFDEWIKPHSEKRGNGSDYFSALCREIIGQQLSGKSATAIINRFNTLFNKSIIDPKKLIKLNDQVLRNVGMSWAKAKYVKNIADAYLTNTVQFSKLHKLPDEEVIEQLTTIKGIGNWTSEMFLIFTLGRENVFSHGDLGLRKGFAKLYQIENPTQKQIEKVVSKWIPFRSYGSIALWHTLDAEIVQANKKIRQPEK